MTRIPENLATTDSFRCSSRSLYYKFGMEEVVVAEAEESDSISARHFVFWCAVALVRCAYAKLATKALKCVANSKNLLQKLIRQH